MKRLIPLILLICSTAYADEVITDFKDDSIPILNEELRRQAKENLWKVSGSDTVLKNAGPVDMQKEQTKQLVLENRTSDPSSPVAGQIWYRSDL